MHRLCWRMIAFGIVALTATTFAQDKFLDSNGVRLRYVDEGSGDSVILVHGYTNAIERNWIVLRFGDQRYPPAIS